MIVNGYSMTEINPGTKKADTMIWEWKNCFKGRSVSDAYGRCSSAKMSSYRMILERAISTDGYNGDIKVTSANCHFYSTMYSFTTDAGTYIVKDTASNIFILKIA